MKTILAALMAFVAFSTSSALAEAPASAPAKDRAEAANEKSPVDVSSEMRGYFVTKVQPILMNACAKCHALDRGGNFKLSRTTSGMVVSEKLTDANMAAFLAHVDRDRIAFSPVLEKSITAHGGVAQPPLRDRKGAAYQHLENWVRMIAPQKPAGNAVTAVPEPVAESPPVDPFDPAIFNRVANPPKK